MKKELNIPMFVALLGLGAGLMCLTSCNASVGVTPTEPGSGNTVKGTLLENEVLYVYKGDTQIESFVLLSNPKRPIAGISCYKVDYTYKDSDAVIEVTNELQVDVKYYFYGNTSILIYHYGE